MFGTKYMAKASLTFFLYLLLVSPFLLNCHCYDNHERKVHIVYLGERPRGKFSALSTHHSILKSLLGSTSSAKESLVYSYGKIINGFAAKLSDEEVDKLKGSGAVISVFPNHILRMHTTRSWDFMGLPKAQVGASQQPHGSSREGDVVIGFLDSGIWPESESFNDEGLGPPPSKWNGTCNVANFTCNNKIIGARYYNSREYYETNDIKSPRDTDGHGTHTASTAAGREVERASYFGLASGTARGGVPNARIAVYKVCWGPGFCTSADVLAAFDDAISDGVDIISISLGYDGTLSYLEDPISIGSFHAMRFGILTSNSAGNSGPLLGTVSNAAPWILTVAANTIDRKFVTKTVLGNGQEFLGLSINSFDLNGTTHPLVWGGDAANFSAGSSKEISRFCLTGTMNSYKVANKIVVCDTLWDIGAGISMADGSGILIADGVGAIFAAPAPAKADFAQAFPLPATLISAEDGLKVLDYIRTTKKPVATILNGETWKDYMSPYIVSFSSRGPNHITPDILKPDLTAPGVDILAAWSPLSSPSGSDDDTRRADFNIISGTSMSCPHASGAAAYVKAVHQDWSPAAIKSALMTTAYVMDRTQHEELEFAYGSGHINPKYAVHPGLVYDASEADYISFLCKQGYNTTALRLITGDNSSSCSSKVPGRAWDLNYPSFSIAIEDGHNVNAILTRTVSNVGYPNSTYKAIIYMPSSSDISVSVEPSVLSFSAIEKKKSFSLKVNGPPIAQEPIISGALFWDDGVHMVRSPIVIYTVLPGHTYSAPSSTTNQNKPNFKDFFTNPRKGNFYRN